jgi:hypothetical protein
MPPDNRDCPECGDIDDYRNNLSWLLQMSVTCCVQEESKPVHKNMTPRATGSTEKLLYHLSQGLLIYYNDAGKQYYPPSPEL